MKNVKIPKKFMDLQGIRETDTIQITSVGSLKDAPKISQINVNVKSHDVLPPKANLALANRLQNQLVFPSFSFFFVLGHKEFEAYISSIKTQSGLNEYGFVENIKPENIIISD